MTTFEYLIALVSVVAALGLARALSGLVRVVHARKSVGASWIHLIWTINLLLWLVSYWWFTFLMKTVATWTLPLLLLVLIYGALIYFLIALLHPEELGEDDGPFEQLVLNRHWFFGSLLSLGVLDVFHVWIASNVTEAGLPDLGQYIPFIAIWIIISVIGIFAKSKLFHAGLALLFLASWLAFPGAFMFEIAGGD